jgi:RimJ/RimL family protein N-acetyltransferase
VSAPRARFDEVELRDLAPDDLDAYVEYWHRPDNPALSALSVDPRKVYSAKKMREMLALTIANNAALPRSQMSTVAIVYAGRTVGVHELTHLVPGDSAVMHAHIWDPSLRGRGIGLISYVKAMRLYFERFGLRTIRFETPKVNSAANRIKEKLGLRARGSGTFDLPILSRAVETDSYAIQADELARVYDEIRRQG